MEQYERYIDNLKIIDVSPNPNFIEKNLSNFSSATVDSIQRENSCKLSLFDYLLILSFILRQ